MCLCFLLASYQLVASLPSVITDSNCNKGQVRSWPWAERLLLTTWWTHISTPPSALSNWICQSSTCFHKSGMRGSGDSRVEKSCLSLLKQSTLCTAENVFMLVLVCTRRVTCPLDPCPSGDVKHTDELCFSRSLSSWMSSWSVCQITLTIHPKVFNHLETPDGWYSKWTFQ